MWITLGGMILTLNFLELFKMSLVGGHTDKIIETTQQKLGCVHLSWLESQSEAIPASGVFILEFIIGSMNITHQLSDIMNGKC